MIRTARIGVSSRLRYPRLRRIFSTAAPDDGDNDEATIDPWRHILDLPARAPWRVSDLDRRIELVQESVIDESSLSLKRMKKAYEAVIESQHGLASRRDRERLRILKNQRYKKSEQKTDESIQTTIYGPEEALACVQYRLKPNYHVLKRVLEETQSLTGGLFKPKTVLDFGIGVGSASAAALHVYGDSIEWIHGIDASRPMREAAEMVLKEFSITNPDKEDDNDDNDNNSDTDTKKIDTTANTTIRIPPRVSTAAHMSETAAPAAFDLALLAYTATDLPHNNATMTAVALLWDKLKPNGILVMVEPGTPDGFSSVRTVRNMLLDCCTEENGDDCEILAPCTHKGACPMERFQISLDSRRTKTSRFRTSEMDVSDRVVEEDEEEEDDDGEKDEYDNDEDGDGDDGLKKGFCSFVQSIPNNYRNKKGEKFTYLVVRKVSDQSRRDAEQNPFAQDKVGDMLSQTLRSDLSELGKANMIKRAIELEDKYLDSDADDLGLELVRGTNLQGFGRIILAPKKKRGHVLIDCCVAPGEIKRYTLAKSDAKAAPGLFRAARKSRWGGFWPKITQ